jgi:hypothetical protein
MRAPLIPLVPVHVPQKVAVPPQLSAFTINPDAAATGLLRRMPKFSEATVLPQVG